jgi:hypothetical protein
LALAAAVEDGAALLVVDEVVDGRPVVGPEVDGVVAGSSAVVDVVDESVEVVVGVVLVPEGVAVVVPVPVPVLVVLVVTGVGSVVPANAAPGTTRVAARARARAAAGRALRMVRCMVPLRCERCRDGCTGTRT